VVRESLKCIAQFSSATRVTLPDFAEQAVEKHLEMLTTGKVHSPHSHARKAEPLLTGRENKGTGNNAICEYRA